MSRTHSQGAHRGMDAAANGEFGRFGRLFPGLEGPEYDEDALNDVAETMIKVDAGQTFNNADEDENPTITAGYTYFGQFVDHDLTLDKTALGESESDPDAISNFRAPALDLDCVYGNGPWGDVVLYDENFKLLVSSNNIAVPAAAAGSVMTKLDHRRDSKGVALIGDPRNDENILVAQLHEAFVSFHNKIMDTSSLMAGVKDRTEQFRRAHRLAGWHFQWVVLHDFLRRICHPAIYQDWVNPGGNPRIRLYKKPDAFFPYMPIEFSAAAYRFGHSMVRPSYALNSVVGTAQNIKRIPIFKDQNNPGPLDDLRGFRPIPAQWGIDWGYFFDSIPGKAPGQQQGSGTAQNAYRIDSILVDPLKKLVNPDIPKNPARERNLAYRNLLRGSRLRLPSAEQVAEELGMTRMPASRFPFLSPEQIWSCGSRFAPDGQTNNETIDEKRAERAGLAERFEGATPLWYYVLREAEWYGAPKPTGGQPADIMGGHHLGPIGSVIVLETFLGLLDADEGSILHQGAWRPRQPIAAGQPSKFDLPALLKWALS